MVSLDHHPFITAKLVTDDRRFASCNLSPTFLRPADVVVLAVLLPLNELVDSGPQV